MATRAFTQVTAVGVGTPIACGPLHIEIYRVQGGTVGDTITIPPARGRFVIAAIHGGGADTTLGTLGTDTQVVFTISSSAASTSVTSDAILYIYE